MSTKHLVKTLLIALFGMMLVHGCALQEPDESSTEQFVTAPTGVTATPTSPSRILLTWAPGMDAVKYYVFQSTTGPAGPYGYRTTATGTFIIIANLMPATEYCFVLRGVDQFNNQSPDSAPPACATTQGTPMAPTPPTGVTATPTSSSRITVAWNAVAMADRYFVYQSVGSAGPYNFINTVLAPGTSLSVANLMPDTTYCYRVASAQGALTSTLSDPPACAKTFRAGLEGFWKVNETSGSVATDASGQGRNGTLVGGATREPNDRAPLDNNRGSILVSGAGADAVSVPDAAPFWFTGPFSVNLWVKLPAAGDVSLMGKRVAGCGTVNWELAQDGAGLHFKGLNGTRVNFNQSLPVGEWTHVAVTQASGTLRAYVNGAEVASGSYTVGPRFSDPMEIGNSGGCGGAAHLVDEIQIWSRQLTGQEVADLGTRPPAPANFVVTPVSPTTVTLTWDAVPGASKYFVYRGTMSGDQVFYNTVLAPNTTFSVGGMAPNETSSWYVAAARNGIISVPSTEQIVMTLAAPNPPASVTATAISSSRIRIDFSTVPGATKYYIYQSDGGPFAFRGTVLAQNPPTYTSVNLLPNTMYSFYVVTDDGFVWSMPSMTASATTFP